MTSKMNLLRVFSAYAFLLLLLLMRDSASADQNNAELAQHRNLGKAFYENPTTQFQAAAEFKKALDLAPDSPSEVINYGLALLRAGKTAEGMATLERAQKMDPSIPHTWFNLGIEFKRQSEYDRSIGQFEEMVRLVPNEPVAHYNLGVLYKTIGKLSDALKEFETVARLDPNLAGPHFQLYNAYRQAGRADDAAREMAVFQEIKKRQAGAAIPEDLEWSFYSEIYDIPEPVVEQGPSVELRFADTKLTGTVEPASGNLAILDVDGDGKSDLLAWSSGGALVFRNGTTTVAPSGLEELREVVSISPGDFDNDGRADIAVLTESGALLYHNTQGRLQRAAIPLPPERFNKAVWLDFDHDYDMDLFLLGTRSVLMRNNGEAGFSDETARFPFVPGTVVDATAFDLIPDTNGFDLVVLYQDRGAVLYQDKLAGVYEAIPVAGLPADSRWMTVYDFNNDSWTDLAVSGPSGMTLIVNQDGVLDNIATVAQAIGPVTFADLKNRAMGDLINGGVIFQNMGGKRGDQKGHAQFILLTTGFPKATVTAAADFDEDGRTDVAYIGADGSLHLAINQTETANHWLRVSLTGVRNLKMAMGAEVEIKTGPYFQKATYQGAPLHFGVRDYRKIDTVRITWPNGLIQNQPQQAVDKAETYKEAQRLSGSCPMVFTWNGSRFEFITDVLGVAPLGASAGDGQYFPTDHDEYIQIPGSALLPVNGQYDIRITEELREVAYLDKIQLIAVDHPADIDLFTNDKFKSPPFPEFRLFGVKNRVYPVAARNAQGQDLRAALLRRDRVYPDGFKRTYSGVAEQHSLELDFGKAALDNQAVLILNGWVDWADGSTFLGAMQEQKGGLVFPYLQVKDETGAWRTVIEDMGIPAGKPKTIVVDLTGKFLSASREVRIVTNLCVYWDDVFLSGETAPPDVRLTPMDAGVAELRYRGFATPTIDPERKQPESFDYNRPMALSMWNPTPGKYTRFGEVKSLLEQIDDRMVIMGSADELALQFPVAGLPPLPEGWTRDFLLYVDGWAKDGDANTAYSQTVEPLPHHGMSQYPYSDAEPFPTDGEHRLYREYYNTRPALRLIRPLTDASAR